MNNLVLKTKYAVLALFVAFSFSCSPEDGEQGPQGEQGIAGTDGNANVQTLIFDVSTQSGSFISLSVPAITQSVIDNDAILTYFSAFNGFHYPSPGPGAGGNYVTRSYYEPSTFNMNINDWDGTSYSITAGEITEIKIIIIESSSTAMTISMGEKDNKLPVFEELNKAGVDVNDYIAVCKFYGIDY
jgi:hypothetical protein